MQIKKETKKHIIIARIESKLDKEIRDWATKKNLPISRFAEMAFLNQISEFENSYENLLELIQNQNSLLNHRDFLINLFKNAKKETIKEAVHIMKDEGIHLEEFSVDEFSKNIEELNKKNLECLLFLILINPNNKKSDNGVKPILENLKKLNVKGRMRAALEVDKSIEEEFKVLLFFKLAKANKLKEEKKDGESEKK